MMNVVCWVVVWWFGGDNGEVPVLLAALVPWTGSSTFHEYLHLPPIRHMYEDEAVSTNQTKSNKEMAVAKLCSPCETMNRRHCACGSSMIDREQG